ncbi:hypothetical protein AeMF1_014673 [Aphanomyces euteiches]|nr:hypothetical protein AeMF1_014673 [Aphanomyces euteiches]KAH9193022.1 hypothetical protein AeNC1_004994 [Aphanomyces euteiches]
MSEPEATIPALASPLASALLQSLQQRDDRPCMPSAAPLGPCGLLRKAKQLNLFENVNDDAKEYKPATAKMRLLDTFRYHKPTVDEQLKYNLPSSVERLCLHKLNDVMSICFARKGNRFSSAEIHTLNLHTSESAHAFEAVDRKFKALSPAVCRYKIPATPPPSDDMDVHNAALEFHELANAYVEAFTQLRDAVLDIRERSVLKRGLVEVPAEGGGDDSEFESKAKAPFPAFLYVLIQKYRRERLDVLLVDTTAAPLPSHPWWPTDTDPPLDSLAQFARFLAIVLLQHVPFLKIELDGIVVLLQVLKCEHTAMEETLCVKLHGREWTEYALSHVVFDFLTTVRELRSIPKRKELLEAGRRNRKKLRRCP